MVKIESVVPTVDHLEKTLDFNREFQLYYPILIKQIVFLLGDKNVADDIVQETLIKYYFTDKRGIDNPRAWLIRVAINLSYNYLRSEKNRKRREEVIFPENKDSVEEQIIKIQEAENVRSALKKLAPRDQMLILLKFTGYSYGEIAKIIGVEQTSVGTLLARAKRRFKGVLADGKGCDN